MSPGAYTRFILRGAPEMIYVKGLFIGFGTVILGTPIALGIWTIWKSQGKAVTVSFSLMGLANHLEHSLGFWVLIVVLFTAGFVPSMFFPKRMNPSRKSFPGAQR